MTDSASRPGPADVHVWDPLVRIFHWSLVAAFSAAYITGEHLERVHVAAGYTVAGLVAFRIVWGFVGPRHARFNDFVRVPSTVITYLKDMALLRAQRVLGHSPAGGAMVIGLLTMLTVTAASGYVLTLPGYARWKVLKEVHEAAANLTLVLVILHVIGVLVSSVLHQENLIAAMFTGRKRAL